MSKSLMINNQAHEPIYEIVFETAFEKLAEKVKQIGLEGEKGLHRDGFQHKPFIWRNGTKGVRAWICECNCLPVSGRRTS